MCWRAQTCMQSLLCATEFSSTGIVLSSVTPGNSLGCLLCEWHQPDNSAMPAIQQLSYWCRLNSTGLIGHYLCTRFGGVPSGPRATKGKKMAMKFLNKMSAKDKFSKHIPGLGRSSDEAAQPAEVRQGHAPGACRARNHRPAMLACLWLACDFWHR